MGRIAGNRRVGALVGYIASRAMDYATTWFYERQSGESKRREQELAPGGALVQVGKELGRALGRELDDEAAGRVGLAVHRTLGVGYGMVASALVVRGKHPFAAGLMVGTAALIVVDEGMAITQFTEYPIESHVRGIVGHGAFGLAAGLLLTLVYAPT